MKTETNYRISGHESFPCRYTWLPKAVRGLQKNPKLFSDEQEAMVELGVGKNMVRAIRFWSVAARVAEAATRGREHSLTSFGEVLLGSNGLDPFLEDRRTLWLIHWNLCSNVGSPLLAWDFLLNSWQDPDIMRSAALKGLYREAAKRDDKLSVVTLERHFETFLHTYVPTRGRKGEVQEDNLDCPLVELELILKVGDREVDQVLGRREPIYVFRRDEKPDITPELFCYCVEDFWRTRHSNESTIPFRELAHGRGSPGQIFKLPEDDIRSRAEGLAHATGGVFTFNESLNVQQVWKRGEMKQVELLREIYAEEAHD